MSRKSLVHTALVFLVLAAAFLIRGPRPAIAQVGGGTETSVVYTTLQDVPAWTAGGVTTSYSTFGASVASAGDVNGDGYADVVVASSYGSQSVYLYLGSATGLAHVPAWISNDGQSGFSGTVAEKAGDVNGDGYADVIVGDSGYSGTMSKQGRAFVFLGSAAGLAASPAWTTVGAQYGYYGASVATAGDVNGDGFSDVIVGEPYYANGQNQEGRALVYLGSAAGISPTPAWTVESDLAGAQFGTSVATAGDVNGDGYSDVIIGAPNYANGETQEGRAFVYLGSAAGLSPTPAWTAESDQARAKLGNSVASAGDVNGDGYGDIIVGDELYYGGTYFNGKVYVYLGSASGPAASPSWTAEGHQDSERLGHSVSNAGDVNKDGFSDVIISSYLGSNYPTDEGHVYVYLGSQTGLAAAPAWTAESDQIGSGFGNSVSSAGDVNGDGASDVIIGAPRYRLRCKDQAGRAYVYLGVPINAPCTGIDADGDGFSTCQGDCDDTHASVYPGAPQICGDGLNNDCGSPDYPSLAGTNEVDDDGDGVSECQGDCDDCNPQTAPGLPEICDGQDNNCDGVLPADEMDVDQDGWSICMGDCDDQDRNTFPGAGELCDGKDNDCDGQLLPGEDEDGDGFFGCQGWNIPWDQFDCDDQNPNVYPGAPQICDGTTDDCFCWYSIVDCPSPDPDWDNDGDGYSICQGDCLDWDSAVHPGAPEICNGVDDDCNGLVDDLGTTTCGQGACQSTVSNCVNGVPQVCTPGIPSAEICNGIDDDCDGLVDEGLGTTTCGQGACQRTVASCVGGVPQVCTPGTPSAEICNGIDDDCDGSVDEDLGTTTCGEGTCQTTVANCVNGVPQVCTPRTSQPEVCNGIDDNCDGQIDEGVGFGTLAVTLQPNELWPPNHRLVDVSAAVDVQSECSAVCPPPSVVLTSITSNEADDSNGSADGFTTDDIQDVTPGAADFDLSLRAERNGDGTGRVYAVTYTATDCLGHSASATALAVVPHDQGGNVEPLAVEARSDASGTGGMSLAWNQVDGASSYNVVRGRLAPDVSTASYTVVEGAECVARQTPGTSVSGGILDDDPAPGEAFIYLVEYVKGAATGYGTESSGRELLVSSGDACH